MGLKSRFPCAVLVPPVRCSTLVEPVEALRLTLLLFKRFGQRQHPSRNQKPLQFLGATNGAKGIATSNKCIASSNKCLTSSNKKLLGARASLLGARGRYERSFLLRIALDVSVRLEPGSEPWLRNGHAKPGERSVELTESI